MNFLSHPSISARGVSSDKPKVFSTRETVLKTSGSCRSLENKSGHFRSRKPKFVYGVTCSSWSISGKVRRLAQSLLPQDSKEEANPKMLGSISSLLNVVLVSELTFKSLITSCMTRSANFFISSGTDAITANHLSSVTWMLDSSSASILLITGRSHASTNLGSAHGLSLSHL